MKFTRKDLFHGKGVVEIESLLPEGAQPFSALLFCELEAGGNVGKHYQPDYPEMIICLSGEGIIGVNDESDAFFPRKSIFLPMGSILSIQNMSSDRKLEYLIIKVKK